MSKRAAPHRGLDVHYGDSDDGDARPSKTQLKEQAHELQRLGTQVLALPAERLERLELSDTLRAAIDEWRRTRSHEGKRRQLQYIGRLMRGADEEALREAVAEAQIGSARATLVLHEAEGWRDALIAGDEALTRWAARFPATDLQQLRALVRQARKEAPAEAALAVAEGRGQAPRRGKAYRELFKRVRQALAGGAGETGNDDAPDSDSDSDPE